MAPGNLREQWLNNGYVVVRGLLARERSDRLLPICEAILDQWRRENPKNGQPGGDPEATVMRHLNHPGYFAKRRDWLPALMEVVADPRVLDVARAVLDEAPMFRCTSLFFNPLSGGRDGNWHRDSQFSTPGDQEERALIAKRGSGGIQMQIALAPSDDVEYVPGSHLRWDTAAEYQIRKADGGQHNRSNDMPGAVRLALEPGDAALFNAMGLHRGRYHADRLRRTLMLTYTPASAKYYDYFSHQPWFLEPGYLDGLSGRARSFFEQFVETYQQDWLAKQEKTATM